MTTPAQGVLADRYAQLGLTPGASLADIRRAYRRRAMELHPDRAGSSGLQAFLAVKAAYEWIVAHRSLAEPGDRRPPDRRPGTAPAATAARPVRRATTQPPRPVWAPPARSSWAGGRWYWEDIRARAARRTGDRRSDR